MVCPILEDDVCAEAQPGQRYRIQEKDYSGHKYVSCQTLAPRITTKPLQSRSNYLADFERKKDCSRMRVQEWGRIQGYLAHKKHPAS